MSGVRLFSTKQGAGGPRALKERDALINRASTPDLLRISPISRASLRWIRAYREAPQIEHRRTLRKLRFARVRHALGLRERP